MAASPLDAVARAEAHIVTDGITNAGWRVRTVKGPIIRDRDTDAFREQLGGDVRTLPEMLFHTNLVELTHMPTGTVLSFTAQDALRGWMAENLPPLQVKVAAEWRRAREHEIQAQGAIQLEYDWTFTTPYAGTISHVSSAHQQPATPASGPAASSAPSGPDQASSSGVPQWEETTEQIQRELLMERDPILFYDEVMLYESDLDDNGVSQVSVKLRVMPKCWLVLMRMWLRVDGCMVRLRESRLFCRHDRPNEPPCVLRETKHHEGRFDELRTRGAPGDGPAWADGDAASQAFGASAPIGNVLLKLEKLMLS